MTSNDKKAILLGLCAVALWSTVATAFKLSLTHVSPLMLVTLASLTSLGFFSTWVVISGSWRSLLRARARDIAIALAIGAFNPALYYYLLFEAYARLPAQEAMALNYTWALTLPLLAAPLLKQALSKRDLIAALTSYVGVVVIATRGAPWSLSMAEPVGVLLAVGSTILWALCWIANTRHALDPIIALFLNFCVAVPVLLVAVVWRGEWQIPPTEGLLGGLYVGFFEMGVSFICWLRAMRLTSSTARISTLIFLSPPISLILISGVLGEPVQSYTLVGLVFIIGGLIYQHRPAST